MGVRVLPGAQQNRSDMMFSQDDDYWMECAFKEAEKAYRLNEVPVGAVVVFENLVIGKGHNLTEQLQDPTAHAEMIAITAAAEYLGSRRLIDTTMYVTLEPCPMCAGALVMSRVSRLVYGASDPKSGACGSLYNIVDDTRLNHRLAVTPAVLESKCSIILSEFFRKLRDTN